LLDANTGCHIKQRPDNYL